MAEEAKDVVADLVDPEAVRLMDKPGYKAEAYKLTHWYGVFITLSNGILTDYLTSQFPVHSMAASWAEHVYGRSALAKYEIKEVPTPVVPVPPKPRDSLRDGPIGMRAVEDAVNAMLGGAPECITMQRADLFNGVFDLRPLLVAMGGTHRELVLKHLDMQQTQNRRGI